MEIVRWTGAWPASPDRMTKINLFETPRFFLDVYVFEPGQSQKPHVHEVNDKIYLVTEGRGIFQVGAERAELGPGDAVLAPAGVEHGAENTGDARLVALAFMAPHPKSPST
ncbi:MAG TPA: cupin domain-containing protein [Candidatus Eisenbacteria bacterium]